MNSADFETRPWNTADAAELPESLTNTSLSSDIAKDYIRQLTTPLLNAEQEVELAQRIEAGTYAAQLLSRHATIADGSREELEWLAADGAQAFDHLFNANLRLVVSRAAKKQYMAQHLDFMDLVSEGNFGLWRAVEKFDYAKGVKFSVYATGWIDKMISAAVYDQDRLVRLPREQDETLRKLKTKAAIIEDTTGRRPSNETIAKVMDLPLHAVETLRPYENDHDSLDRPINISKEQVRTLGDIVALAAEPDEARHKLQGELVHNRLLRQICKTALSSRNADIITSMYGLDGGTPQSRAEVARQYGLRGPSIGYARDKALQLFATMPLLRELYDAS